VVLVPRIVPIPPMSYFVPDAKEQTKNAEILATPE
jgi:hypothetical protein